MNGKGSWRRPYSRKQFAANFDDIKWSKPKRTKAEKTRPKSVWREDCINPYPHHD